MADFSAVLPVHAGTEVDLLVEGGLGSQLASPAANENHVDKNPGGSGLQGGSLLLLSLFDQILAELNVVQRTQMFGNILDLTVQ